MMPFVEPHPGHSAAIEEGDGIVLSNDRSPSANSIGLTVPDRVALAYYKHGLLCSSYPWCTIIVAIIVVLISCHPLLTLPFPGNEPEELFLTRTDAHPADFSQYPYPKQWGTRQPLFYVQQIVVRSAVIPWTGDLGLMDAFRGPLSEVFKIHSEVMSFHSPQSNLTLRDICLFAKGLAPSARVFQSVLPEFNCLTVSPANIWQLNENSFRDDPQFLDTIFSYRNPVVDVRSSMADLFFGISLRDSGIKKYPVKTRSRVITYALTLILNSYSEPLLRDLNSRLHSLYPLHYQETTSAGRRSTVHIFYPERFNYLELIPLMFVFFTLFIYVYFSVRKIEMVKSKIGMAFSALVTVVASLAMSIGLCSWFGLKFTVQSKDIFPYLLVVIGLENILVLTRSVVSTPVNLDVKIRVAQGLSREGWNITKNLLTEVTILTVGFFTFVPAIQEFCMFAVVALLSDFVLQMIFFTTVLSIDILRMELSEIQRHRRQLQPGQQYMATNHSVSPVAAGEKPNASAHRNLRPRVAASKSTPTPIVAPSSYTHNRSASARMPRRVRVVHFWARTRLIQRTFMVGVVIWMGVFVYRFIIFEHLAATPYGWILSLNDSAQYHQQGGKGSCSEGANCAVPGVVEEALNRSHQEAQAQKDHPDVDSLSRLQHPKNFEFWRRLSHRHWPDLLAMYNYSLAGNCIAILPPIRLSVPVQPDRLQEVRNKADADYLSRSRWKSLASALDSLDVLDGEDSDFNSAPIDAPPGQEEEAKVPYVPSSPLEIVLAALLAVPSITFIAYVTVVLYRCICSRHYAEWRSSSSFWPWAWAGNASGGLNHESREYYSQIVAESMPLVLDGHRAPVECISADGEVVASACLAGQLFMWDILTGDRVAQIDRSAYFSSVRDRRRSTDSSPAAAQRVELASSPVWCMQCFHGLVALGCANGRIEVWSQDSELRCLHDDGGGVGIVKLKTCGEYIVCARLNGVLETFQMRASYRPVPGQLYSVIEEARNECQLVRLNWARAHQQPITILEVSADGSRVVSGSQDHCIKVWRLETLMPVYSLHGHCGPITALFIDNAYPCSASGSGSQDGMLCMWDLSSGTCVYSLQAHDGSVSLLTYTSSYVISLGADDKLCVWERFQGHLLNTLSLTRVALCGSLSMLNDRLLVTSRQGSLVVWDVRSGEPIREVRLGDADHSTFVRQVVIVRDSVICDYGTQLRIVSFPMIATHKIE